MQYNRQASRESRFGESDDETDVIEMNLERGMSWGGNNSNNNQKSPSFRSPLWRLKATPSTRLRARQWSRHPQSHVAAALHAPLMACAALTVFCVLATTGLTLIYVLGGRVEASQYSQQAQAELLAKETCQNFLELLDRAFLPLYTLVQLIQALPDFQHVPAEIGIPDSVDARPFVPATPGNVHQVFRNVSGICDDPVLQARFAELVESMDETMRLDLPANVLLNLQLAPAGVVCFISPLITNIDNTTVLDMTGSLGLDTTVDPACTPQALEALGRTDLVRSGPSALPQCQYDDCDEAVPYAFTARLSVQSDSFWMGVHGVPVARWGYAAAVVNWQALVNHMGLIQAFAEHDLAFQLTRTEVTEGRIGEEDTTELIVLTETPGYEEYARDRMTVSKGLAATDDEWTMTVAYAVADSVDWQPWTVAAVLVVALALSGLLYMMLLQQQLHHTALAEKAAIKVDAANRSTQHERELNDFLAHEVRNPLSAAISACTFVSAAVYETEPLCSEETRQSVREDVSIMETSLQFINDLLRNMLDMHKAASRQLKVERTATDILRDVLDPVAAMLTRREGQYIVAVECPPDLVGITDPMRLKQIILNLGRNATKFVESGFIRLRAKAGTTDPTSLYLYVEDSGPGIPVEKRRIMFHKYQESLDSLNQGTGIGLNLCRSLVELLGGSIWLDEGYDSGVPGSPGARFCVRLDHAVGTADSIATGSSETLSVSEEDLAVGVAGEPSALLSDHAFEQDDEEEEKDAALPEELRVLFVDDDIILRKLFTRSVRKVQSSWTIEEAASGEAALSMVQKGDFDLIFLDQYMASVTKSLLGTETARALRVQGSKAIICGLSANELEGPFLAAGANAFLFKPFPCKEEELRRELRRILYGSPLQQSDVR